LNCHWTRLEATGLFFVRRKNKIRSPIVTPHHGFGEGRDEIAGAGCDAGHFTRAMRSVSVTAC
jgi:hypothetical protein